MPTIKITAKQVVYYEKTIELPQDEYDELMSLQDDGGWMTDEVNQWLVDGDSGLGGDDVVEGEGLEDLEIETIKS